MIRHCVLKRVVWLGQLSVFLVKIALRLTETLMKPIVLLIKSKNSFDDCTSVDDTESTRFRRCARVFSYVPEQFLDAIIFPRHDWCPVWCLCYTAKNRYLETIFLLKYWCDISCYWCRVQFVSRQIIELYKSFVHDACFHVNKSYTNWRIMCHHVSATVSYYCIYLSAFFISTLILATRSEFWLSGERYTSHCQPCFAFHSEIPLTLEPLNPLAQRSCLYWNSSCRLIMPMHAELYVVCHKIMHFLLLRLTCMPSSHNTSLVVFAIGVL